MTASNHQPLISVLVITRNRAHLLPRLFDALWKQDFPRDSFEVVAIDDGSTDNTCEYLRSLGDKIQWSTQHHGGVAKARNASARHARGRILAFTDDDCLPEANWLRAIHRKMGSNDYAAALLGRTYSELPSSTFVHSVFKDSEPVVTCNFAVTREAFEKVGGFDERFSWYFEDEDLGIRLKEAGYPIVFVPEMVVYHPSRYQGFRQYVRQRSGMQYFYYVSVKHPTLNVWRRHEQVLRLIRKKVPLFLLPLLIGCVWAPGFVLLALILAVHIAVDFRRLSRTYTSLGGTSLRGRRSDLIMFSLLNWTIPFIDAYQIAKGCIRDGLFSRRSAHI